MPNLSSPPPLPAALLDEAPSVKLLYLWVSYNGEVTLSQRAIASALGVTQASVSLAVKRLIELGLISRGPLDKPRVRGRLSAVR